MVARFIKVLGRNFRIPDPPLEVDQTRFITAGNGLTLGSYSSGPISIGYAAVEPAEIVLKSSGGAEIKSEGDHWYVITPRGKKKKLV